MNTGCLINWKCDTFLLNRDSVSKEGQLEIGVGGFSRVMLMLLPLPVTIRRLLVLE
jgi:hypothetical protein